MTPAVNLTYEQWLGALCAWREARGAGTIALTAVWAVLQNRAKDEANRWPKTIVGVILQPEQFSSFNPADPNSHKFPVEGSGADWVAFLNCQHIVTIVDQDPTGGANAYESIDDPEKRPAWAREDDITAKIGPFRFYRL